MKLCKDHMNATVLRMIFFVLLSTVINIHAMDDGRARTTKESLDIQQAVKAYWGSLSELQRASKRRRDSKVRSTPELEYALSRFGDMHGLLGYMIENLARLRKVDDLLKLRSSLEGIDNTFAMYCGLLHSSREINDVMRRYGLTKIVEQKREEKDTKTGIIFAKERFCRQELQTNRVPNEYRLVGKVRS